MENTYTKASSNNTASVCKKYQPDAGKANPEAAKIAADLKNTDLHVKFHK